MKCPRCEQQELVGGKCDGCKASYGMADIDALVDTQKAWQLNEKLRRENAAMRDNISSAPYGFVAVGVTHGEGDDILHDSIRGKLVKESCVRCRRPFRVFRATHLQKKAWPSTCPACTAIIDAEIKEYHRTRQNQPKGDDS